MSNLRDLLEYYVLASITTLEPARAFCTKLATKGGSFCQITPSSFYTKIVYLVRRIEADR